MLYLEACYKAGKKELAEKVRLSLRKDMEQQRKYYISMNKGITPDISPAGADNNDPMFRSMLMEYRINEAMMIVLEELEKKYEGHEQIIRLFTKIKTLHPGGFFL